MRHKWIRVGLAAVAGGIVGGLAGHGIATSTSDLKPNAATVFTLVGAAFGLLVAALFAAAVVFLRSDDTRVGTDD